jgi:hypothetical protein
MPPRGVTHEWLMSARGGDGGNVVLPSATGWNMVAAGNFNPDSTTDLLWQNVSDGSTSGWLMSASGGLSGHPGTPLATDYTVVGIRYGHRHPSRLAVYLTRGLILRPGTSVNVLW